MMVLPLLALLAAAPDGQTAFLSKPNFGFECRPKDAASAVPAFEYRIYLKSTTLGAENAAMTRISVSKGLPKSIEDTALDDGLLISIALPPQPGVARDPNKTSYRFGLVEKSSPSADGISYALNMLISVELTAGLSGEAGDIEKSTGSLTVRDKNGAKRFDLDCLSIKHRYDK